MTAGAFFSYPAKSPGDTLFQGGGDDEPDAIDAFAVSLAGGVIAREGVEGVAVVLDLIAVGVRDDGEFAGESGGTGRC